MCTIHADSSATVFNKLALYAMQAPERLPIEATALLASAAIDLVVFISKKGNDRYVSSVRQVVGASGPTVITNELFEPGPAGRAVPAMAVPVDLAEELADVGWDAASHRWNPGWAR
jgi:Flp pilus assembly CpaF family ATPase